jgi:hypothetical protein
VSLKSRGRVVYLSAAWRSKAEAARFDRARRKAERQQWEIMMGKPRPVGRASRRIEHKGALKIEHLRRQQAARQQKIHARQADVSSSQRR